MVNFQVLDQDLFDRIQGMNAAERGKYLFLEPHAELPNHWAVNSWDARYTAHLFDVLGQRQAVTPFKLATLLERAEQQGYAVVFMVDPVVTFDWLRSLMDQPNVTINSQMMDTVNGFLPFQVQGFNMLKQISGGLANWSTGTGKTVLAAGLTKHHFEEENFDICVWAVKAHNKVNTQRALKTLVGMDSIIIDGTQKQREAQYRQVATAMLNGERPIVITNYEKFRDEKAFWIALFQGTKVFVVWDEMPTKLSARTSKLYKSVTEILYKSYMPESNRQVYYPKVGGERPSELRQIALSATPIENDPEGYFNIMRLLDPSALGSVRDFNNTYPDQVRVWPRGGKTVLTWKNLDLMGAKTSFMVHQVDKASSDIASQFPSIIEETIYVDLDPADQRLYDKLANEYRNLGAGMLEVKDILAAIGVFQMICDNPRMVAKSAELAKRRFENQDSGKAGEADDEELDEQLINLLASVFVPGTHPVATVATKFVETLGTHMFTDVNRKGECRNAKLLALRDILDGLDNKAVVFTTFGQLGLPLISAWLTEWNIGHVCYHGSLTMDQKQEAEDRFKNDPDCKVFLSSDAGADSINLEVADTVIHYDLPWKWSTMVQRQNRAHRITSAHAQVRFITLAVAGSVEDRKREILDTKYEYHQQILKGEIAEQGEALRGKDDLLYILTGE